MKPIALLPAPVLPAQKTRVQVLLAFLGLPLATDAFVTQTL